MQKAKLLSEKALQIPEKNREAKSRGEKERYIQLNAEFQRIARRDKKVVLSEQCKVQFSSVQSCLTLCDPMDSSTRVFPVHHQLSELTQTQVHRVSDAIQP